MTNARCPRREPQVHRQDGTRSACRPRRLLARTKSLAVGPAPLLPHHAAVRSA